VAARCGPFRKAAGFTEPHFSGGDAHLPTPRNIKDWIETVWGRGYLLREPSEHEVLISAWARLFSGHHVLLGIDAVDLEYVLGYIQTGSW
jgi:hypothetical protein